MNLVEKVSAVKNLVNGYKSTYIIIAAARIGVFDVLAKSSATANEIAKVLNTDEKRIEPLLNALTSYKLIEKSNEVYALTEYREILDPSSPFNQLGYINHALNMCDKWRDLEKAVMSREVALDNFEDITGDNLDATRAFLQAMNTNAIPQARFISSNFDFDGHRFIDIGAGFGTYSIEIIKNFPNAQGIAFDLPVAASIINENVQAAGLSDRLKVLSGDYNKDLPSEKCNDAFLFAVIHQEDIQNAKQLIKAAFELLENEGRLFITSFFLDDDRIEPAFSVLFGVEMLVGSQQGRVYAHSEIRSILIETGFTDIKCIREIPSPATLYVATKH